MPPLSTMGKQHAMLPQQLLKPESGCDTFRHTPLHKEKQQIRLLEIHPVPLEQPTGAKCCEMKISLCAWDFSETPRYAALSYAWGDPGDTTSVLTEDNTELVVTQNCAYALWQLSRQPFNYFWIDAICINQSDVQERSAQVNFMGDIFSQAECVFTSLGPYGHPGESTTMEHVKTPPLHFDLSNQFEWLESFDEESCRRFFGGLESIAIREYWHRAWVVQEFVKAKEVFVLVGTGSCQWAQLYRLVKSVSGYYPRHKQTWWPREQQREIRNSPLLSFALFRGVAGRCEAGKTVNMQLRSCLEMMCQRHCYDLRDRVFSILKIVDWQGGEAPLQADYSKTWFQLAVKLLDYLGTWPHTIELVARLFQGYDDISILRKLIDPHHLETIQIITIFLDEWKTVPDPTSKHWPSPAKVMITPPHRDCAKTCNWFADTFYLTLRRKCLGRLWAYSFIRGLLNSQLKTGDVLVILPMTDRLQGKTAYIKLIVMRRSCPELPWYEPVVIRGYEHSDRTDWTSPENKHENKPVDLMLREVNNSFARYHGPCPEVCLMLDCNAEMWAASRLANRLWSGLHSHEISSEAVAVFVDADDVGPAEFDMYNEMDMERQMLLANVSERLRRLEGMIHAHCE